MNSLFINSLLIFDLKDEVAKRIDFSNKINVITASKTDGNDRGKSIILKSLYHTLGADSYFDDKWNTSSKLYLMQFEIDSTKYYVYRVSNFFKIYKNSLNEKVFETVNRSDLSEFLSKLFSFKVLLPNRKEDKLELTPPAYSYLLNFVDQDHMNGASFASFKSLGQFGDIKENTLFNHFGIYNEDYFNIVKNVEKYKDKNRELNKELEIIKNMIQRINIYTDGKASSFDVESLKEELNVYHHEYSMLVGKLGEIKDSLLVLHNEKFKLEKSIDELIEISKKDYKEIKKITRDICPTCNQGINQIELKIDKNNKIEDLYLMKNELDTLIVEVNRKLDLKEDEYKTFSQKIEFYKKKVNAGNEKISDVLKHMGYSDAKDNLLKDLNTINSSIKINDDSLDIENKKLKQFLSLRKKATDLYKKFMLEAKYLFSLEEIKKEKFDNLKNTFSARGSNKPIATIIWYFNLLKIKNELNPSVIKFPLVLDSPNNVELEEEKRIKLFKYIFKNNIENSQLIISTLGFDSSEYEEVNIDNIHFLDNSKYNLLNREDYIDNLNILKEVINN